MSAPLTASAKWALEHGLGLLSLVGLLIYGIVRLGIDSFYGRLGVTAEEVGLTYTAVLNRAALGFLVIVLAVLVGAALLAAYFIVAFSFARQLSVAQLGQADGPANKSGTLTRLEAGQIMRPWVAIAWLSVIGGMFRLAFPVTWFAPSTVSSTTLRLLYVIDATYVLVGALITVFYTRRAMAPATPTVPPSQVRARIVAALLGAIALIVLIVSSGVTGDRAAKQVESGNTLARGPAFSVAWIINVDARCVSIVDATDGTRPSTRLVPQRALYLGRSDNIAIVYAVGTGPIRLPISNYAIKDVGIDSCRTPAS